jgi:hypothetical protein
MILIRPASHLIMRSNLFWLSTVVLVLAMSIPALAGVAVGSVLTNAADADQRRVAIFYEAQKSYQEKLRVGQLRYKMMQTNRANILAGMTSELAARQQVVVIPSTPASYAEKSEPQTWTGILLGVAVLGLGFLGFRYYLNRQNMKDAAGHKY